ncbi:hypothetical protein [Glycomyces sp. YM15]|uniref:hypothetical protein n=1 Tax=Glycomyces sp. YM15 TaxID=2800446 RepID=UPI0019637D45|nr:hypothetical protein [Glycomyces sp. YM15]
MSVNRHFMSIGIGIAAALALLATGCDANSPDSDPSSEEASSEGSAAAEMQAWTEFCDKADPDVIAEHFSASAVTIDDDGFTGEGAFGEVASGSCGGTFEFEPGNSVPFQVALRAYGSASEARESLDEWRDADTGPAPANEVGAKDADLWIVQQDMGSTYKIDGSVAQDFYRITFTVTYLVYDEENECGESGPACTEDPVTTLQWFEATYLPGLIARIDETQR